MRRWIAITVSTLWMAALPALAQEEAVQAETETPQEEAAQAETAQPATAAAKKAPKAKSLDELLRQVQAGWRGERAEMQRRENEFKKARQEQQRLLEQATATRIREEQRSEELEKIFEENEGQIAALEDTLRERLGTLGELFGVVRQVAGDTRSQVENSLVSSQMPGREEFLIELGKKRSLPSIASLEKLWFTLQQEMTESGKIVRFPTTVVSVEGKETQRDVIRAGVFSAVSAGRYLHWDPELLKLVELRRQPPSRYLSTVKGFEKATEGLETLAIDPSRGSILALLVETPSFGERIEQGGPIGYAIIVLGILAGAVGLVRFVIVFLTNRKVRAQSGSSQASTNNPLGRVLAVFDENRDADLETLELKLDEAILRESAKLERFLWAIKVVSVVAPLMGLLGTVTGMIRTFQAITLFGAGDPKMMAGGISEALVTTMLGLCVAIPLVLIHAFVSSGKKEIVEVLEEQTAGMVAQRVEAGAARGSG
jgi:biopolymer transport protein ExbB